MDSPSHPTPSINLLSSLTPPSLSRAWLTAPHPRLPLLATCSSDRNVRIYSLTSFTLVSTITGGHKRSVRSVAWKPGTKGESVLATGSFDASVGLWKHWDEDAGGGLLTVQLEREEVDFTQGNDEENNEEEDEEWRFALVLDGHDSEVKSVAWSTGGNLLATCSRDKSVWIWEEVGEDDFETVAVLQEHTGDVKCVAWHPEEECVASGSYDDDIRVWREDVDDWTCVALLRGHEGTVWSVGWEAAQPKIYGENESEGAKRWLDRREKAGPRILSCSDDMSIRVWRKIPREKGPAQSKLSIIRSGSIDEEWIEEARLPARHERAIYATGWSERTGRVVSTGGDGKIVVYEEKWKGSGSKDASTATTNGNTETMEGIETNGHRENTGITDNGIAGDAKHGVEDVADTEWVVVAEIEGAHGVFEVNHVCWTRRADKGKRRDDEEIIVSTGDDGVVKAWVLDV